MSEVASAAPFRHVVAGYDGSDGAAAAVAFALWLAGKAGAETTLLHACPSPGTPSHAAALPAVVDRRLTYEVEWQRRLEDLRDYGPAHATIHCRLGRGSPAGALIAAAAETDADLLLVGSRGAGPLRGALLGSVSSQLLAHAPCSVMVFRENAAPAPATQASTVLAGIDGSPSSSQALRLAQALAVLLRAKLVLVHAHDPDTPFLDGRTEAGREALRRSGHQLLHDARATVAAPLDVVEEELVDGRAVEVLVEACERHSPAVLTLGSRGLGGFEGLLLGSTSRGAAHHVSCPVLVARPKAASVP